MSKSTELDQAAKIYIISCMEFSGYDCDPSTVEEGLKMVQQEFEQTFGHEIKRQGYQVALAEWFSGLPSIINIEYRSHAIIELAVAWGSIPANATDKQHEKILENWWSFMANKTAQLFRGYRTPKGAEL